jgi:hypothetical protein
MSNRYRQRTVDGTGDATGSLLKGTSELGESPRGAGGDAMGAEADGTGAAGGNSGDGPAYNNHPKKSMKSNVIIDLKPSKPKLLTILTCVHADLTEH